MLLLVFWFGCGMGWRTRESPALPLSQRCNPNMSHQVLSPPRPCLVSCVGRPGLGHFIWTRFALNSVSDTSNYVLDLTVRRHCYGGTAFTHPVLGMDTCNIQNNIFYNKLLFNFERTKPCQPLVSWLTNFKFDWSISL